MIALKVLPNEPIIPKKPPVDPSTLAYKELLRGPFWQRIPAYATVTEEQFLDHNWQAKNSITNPAKLLAAVQELVPAAFIQDAAPFLPTYHLIGAALMQTLEPTGSR